MEQEILKLRKALVHYEECIDVNAAEHIMIGALMDIINECKEISKVATKVIDDLM